MAWVVLGISGWAVFRGDDTVERCLGLTNVAAVWAYYTHSRTKQKGAADNPLAPLAPLAAMVGAAVQSSSRTPRPAPGKTST